MRLLKIEGDFVAIYEGRKRLAVYAGASHLTQETAEQLRLASQKAIDSDAPEQNSGGNAA
jgi:hypothetical protein